MTLDEIPKFVLTLPEKPHRGIAALDHFRTSNVGPITLVNGISGQQSGLRTLFPYEVDNPGSGFNIGAHCVGIWLSHYMLWQACALLPGSHMMIFEDDAQFLPGWRESLSQALRDVPPDFDWLFVGSCCADGAQKRQIAGQVWEVRWPACNHAYIIAKKAMPYLLSTCRKCYAPIDLHTILHSFAGMKVYTILPRLVAQWNTVISP
ncbi:MAG: glycosyltransferase family 25 protein [Solirubrobacterales bacterium]